MHEIPYALPNLLGNLREIQWLKHNPSKSVFVKDNFCSLGFIGYRSGGHSLFFSYMDIESKLPKIREKCYSEK